MGAIAVACESIQHRRMTDSGSKVGFTANDIERRLEEGTAGQHKAQSEKQSDLVRPSRPPATGCVCRSARHHSAPATRVARTIGPHTMRRSTA
jgi:hypothetical protein